jgi:hypothetical protein
MGWETHRILLVDATSVSVEKLLQFMSISVSYSEGQEILCGEIWVQDLEPLGFGGRHVESCVAHLTSMREREAEKRGHN